MDRYLKCKNKTSRDEEYVEAYRITHSQIKAAQLCGVSRETIARAVRRAEIKLDGTKYNNGQQNGMLKISDDEIRQECRIYTRNEIAKRHSMNLCNVDRRLKRLNLKCATGLGDGSGHSHYSERCVAYDAPYDRNVTLSELYKRDKGICQICGKPTDQNDRDGNKIGKMYPTLDHIIPLSKGGGHIWGNVQLAHMICNSKKQDRIFTV